MMNTTLSHLFLWKYGFNLEGVHTTESYDVLSIVSVGGEQWGVAIILSEFKSQIHSL